MRNSAFSARGSCGCFPETNHCQSGPDLSIGAARFRHLKIDSHVIHPDFPRRREIPITNGRPRNRNAVRGERQAGRERFEPRSGGAGIGTRRAPIVESPKAQPLDRQTLEMEPRPDQGPQAEISPDLTDRKDRGRRAQVQGFPSHLSSHLPSHLKPRTTNSPSGSEIWKPLAATGRSSAAESRSVAMARSRSWSILPVTATTTATVASRRSRQPARRSPARRNPRAGVASALMSLLSHAGYGSGQTSPSNSSSVTSPREKLPLSRRTPSASMTQ